MRLPPASVLASWPTPNYDDPITRGDAGKIVGITLTVLVALILIIPSVALTVCSIYAEFELGWDVHVWDLPFTKYSSSSQMSPVSAYWTLSANPQRCINEAAHLLVAGIINTITDFVIVILPIKMTASLQLPRRQHIILYALFCTGFCACAAGCVRTYYTWILTTNYDKTWYGWTVWISSAIELYLGIACASIPACRHFFTHRHGAHTGSTHRSGDHSQGSRPGTSSWLANESMVALNEMLAAPPRAELRPTTTTSWPPVRPASADGRHIPARVWADGMSGEHDVDDARPKTAV
ncbi:hypothetical protein G7054_g8900 [Neopestalotiopsis clavispora]|nr:hypothetical protein G7054_g8900 [Neopestalotiopsis clavispora]